MKRNAVIAAMTISMMAASSFATAGTNTENCEAFRTVAQSAYAEYKRNGDEMAVIRNWADKNTAAGAAANHGTNAVKQGLSKEAAGQRAYNSCMDFLD